jgi:hypothetical protein
MCDGGEGNMARVNNNIKVYFLSDPGFIIFCVEHVR